MRLPIFVICTGIAIDLLGGDKAFGYALIVVGILIGLLFAARVVWRRASILRILKTEFDVEFRPGSPESHLVNRVERRGRGQNATDHELAALAMVIICASPSEYGFPLDENRIPHTELRILRLVSQGAIRIPAVANLAEAANDAGIKMFADLPSDTFP
jgi:hypothetical protein